MKECRLDSVQNPRISTSGVQVVPSMSERYIVTRPIAPSRCICRLMRNGLVGEASGFQVNLVHEYARECLANETRLDAPPRNQDAKKTDTLLDQS